jgi:chromodomain-helicase-DNA-binding protein 7
LFYKKDYIDEEEGDDQFIEFEPTKNGYRSEEFEEYLKKKFLNNEIQYINFDRNTLKVDRVVSCSEMFDIIHPKKAGKIMSKWSDSIVKIVQILINFRYENVSSINFRSITGFSF